MEASLKDTAAQSDLSNLDTEDRPATTEAGQGPEAPAGDASADGLDMQALAAQYERHRVDAVATLDHLAAAVQMASATLRWNADDVAALGTALGQIDQHAINLRNAVQARLELVDLAASRKDARAAPPTPAPSPAPAPASADPFLPPEVHLLTMVRCLEAVRLRADELLRAVQTQPRDGEPIFGRLDHLQSYAEAASMAYVEYALGIGAEIRA